MPRPRRQIPRATAGQGRTLDPATEWELAVWQGLRIDGMGLDSLEEFRAAWADHGAAITAAWRLSMPGSRPWGAYVVGVIPPPAIIATPYRDDAGRQIGERIFFEAHAHGAGDEGELSHLVALDLVDADEERAARRRIAAHGSRCLYQWIGSTAAAS